jgi:hypothetical protein
MHVLKLNLDEVDKAMFQGVEKPRESIFSILEFEKSDFDEVV